MPERLYKQIHTMILNKNTGMHDIFDLVNEEITDLSLILKCMKRLEAAGIVKIFVKRKFTIISTADKMEKFIRIENGSDEKIVTRIRVANRIRCIVYPEKDKKN